MELLDTELEFIYKVNELIRDVGESGVEYITY